MSFSFIKKCGADDRYSAISNGLVRGALLGVWIVCRQSLSRNRASFGVRLVGRITRSVAMIDRVGIVGRRIWNVSRMADGREVLECV